MDLQDTFYILGIIYMSVMLLIVIGLLTAVLVIKKKVDSIHQHIEDKLSIFTNIAHTGSTIVDAAKKAVRR